MAVRPARGALPMEARPVDDEAFVSSAEEHTDTEQVERTHKLF